MKLPIFLFALIISPLSGLCQEDSYYRDEYHVGLNLNTNGGLIGGVSGKQIRHLYQNKYRMFTLDLVNVKHDQEQRYPSAYTGNLYVIKKQNYFFVIRPSYGREYVLFKRAPDEGVQVNGAIGGGLSLGVLKPYFINYDYSKGRDQSDVRSEPFMPGHHDNEPARIVGRGSIFSGIGQSSIVPGLNLRGSLNFQFGNSGRTVSGIEVGGVVEGFFKFGNGSFISPAEINIIPYAEKDWLFTALFVNIYYGLRK